MKNNGRDIIVVSAIIILVLLLAFVVNKNNRKENVNMIVAVHIKGEVKNPGYYELKYGSRVKDGIEKAGGATKNANLESLNLAAKLRDGEEIIVPSKGKTVSYGEGSAEGTSVNINTADLNELCTLEGIGEDTAKSIIDYRTHNGGFGKIEDLKKVGGIGNAKFEAIKDKIVV